MLATLAAATVAARAQSGGNVLRDLELHGMRVAESAEPGALRFERAFQTMDQPLRAFKLSFETSSSALMKSADAEKDRVAFLKNTGKAEVWQRKFCSASLGILMQRYKVDLVSGDLHDGNGETQSLAICQLSSDQPAPSTQPKVTRELTDFEVTGTWTDDSPQLGGDWAVLAIKAEGGHYLFGRLRRGQDLEVRGLRRAGSRFFLEGDPSGAYFVVRDDGLAICDSSGCSRVARRDRDTAQHRVADAVDEKIAAIKEVPSIDIRRAAPRDEVRGKASNTSSPLPEAEVPTRAHLIEWFSANLPALQAWGRLLGSIDSLMRDVTIGPEARLRFCTSSLAESPAKMGPSGDGELDETASLLQASLLEALRTIPAGDEVHSQLLLGQARNAIWRLDRRLKSLGIVVQ